MSVMKSTLSQQSSVSVSLNEDTPESGVPLFELDRKPSELNDALEKNDSSKYLLPGQAPENTQKRKSRRKHQLLHSGIDHSDLYLTFNTTDKRALNKEKERRNKLVEEVMKKSVITPDFEKLHEVPPYEVSLNQLKKARRAARAQSKGPGWFDMGAQELTDEVKNDLDVVRMRSALDPKRFYKRPDLKTYPKFFQTGVVVENPADFYSGRIPRKQRKQTLVDELLADADFHRYRKRKQEEIQAQKSKKTGAYKHIKKLKKRKK